MKELQTRVGETNRMRNRIFRAILVPRAPSRYFLALPPSARRMRRSDEVFEWLRDRSSRQSQEPKIGFVSSLPPLSLARLAGRTFPSFLSSHAGRR